MHALLFRINCKSLKFNVLLTAFDYHFVETPVAGGSGAVTVVDSTGKSVKVSQSMVAQAQLGLVQPGPDGTVTVQGSDGQPVQITQAALAATGGKRSMTAKSNPKHDFLEKCAWHIECSEQLKN